MAKKNKTVKELNVEFELLSERILKLEERNNISDGKSDHEKIDLILKQYDEKKNILASCWKREMHTT